VLSRLYPTHEGRGKLRIEINKDFLVEEYGRFIATLVPVDGRFTRFGGGARMGVAASLAACLIALGIAGIALAQESARVSADTNPGELVRATVANEVAASNDASIKHLFCSRKQSHSGTQTRLFVETRDAIAAMTIAYDDHPLSAQQAQDEQARLDGLKGNPEELARKHSQEKNDAERTARIVRALPDAFLYEYAGTEKCRPGMGKEGDELVRLKFRPNPAYTPPSRVEEVLRGMQGFVLIDAAARRLARIDATLFKEVSFGWGIFGHLDKGGHFGVEQAALPDGSWDISRMQLSFTGKILLFKSLNISADEVFSDFRRVPADITFAKGVEMLKAEEARLAAEHIPEAAALKSH